MFLVLSVYRLVSVSRISFAARLRPSHGGTRFVPPAHRLADDTALVQSPVGGCIQQPVRNRGVLSSGKVADQNLVLPYHVLVDSQVLFLPLCVGHVGVLRSVNGALVDVVVFRPPLPVVRCAPGKGDAVDVALKPFHLSVYLIALGQPREVNLPVGYIQCLDFGPLDQCRVDGFRLVCLVVQVHTRQRAERQFVLACRRLLVLVVQQRVKLRLKF